ncbi:sensor histidine kinase [Streptomyces sp. NPDC051554]|uniref:sensor histidine kinase n=1 Tax=Streptomyces sp. NPDC051554 TaxID=3365656 RepID=UPI0037AD0E0E
MPETPPPPLMRRVPPGVVVACVWALSTLYTFVAKLRWPGEAWTGEVDKSPHLDPFPRRLSEWAMLGIAAVLVCFACRLLARRPLWSTTMLVLSALLMNADFHTFAIAPGQYLPVCVALYFVAATRSRRTALIGVGLAFTGLFGYMTVCLVRGFALGTSVEAVVVLMVVTAWVLGESQRREQLLVEMMRVQVAEKAVTAERLRIARELHDMVAHSIGVVALQAGAAKLVIGTQPEGVRKALGIIEDTSRETLAGLRRVLGALHDAGAVEGAVEVGAPLAGLGDIDRLVENVRSAGVRVDLEWRGERRPLPPEIDLSAFRIIQESVTNVVKHSGTQQCRVSVVFQPDDVSVMVVDSGTRNGSGGEGIGYGLAGMRERVELLHGDFSAGPRPEGGFRVTARLPVPS